MDDWKQFVIELSCLIIFLALLIRELHSTALIKVCALGTNQLE